MKVDVAEGGSTTLMFPFTISQLKGMVGSEWWYNEERVKVKLIDVQSSNKWCHVVIVSCDHAEGLFSIPYETFITTHWLILPIGD